MKLVRAGNLLTGYESADGVNWTTVGSDTFTLGPTVLIGLAVSSHVTGVNATATFDNVTVSSANPPPNQPPTVSLTSPAAGATFTAPATIAFAASASDSDGTIAKVEFFSGTTLLGTDTTAPYQFSWSNVPVGTYVLKAVATDDDGAVTSSSTVTVTVSSTPPPNQPPAVSLTSPAAGATFTAPATIAFAASASDTDGTIAKVEFYSGTTLRGTDTSAPYQFSWSNVPAGTYVLRRSPPMTTARPHRRAR